MSCQQCIEFLFCSHQRALFQFPFLYYEYNYIALMRKYQQWQQTQTYFQHISQLNRIRIRKPIYSPQKHKKLRLRSPNRFSTQPNDTIEYFTPRDRQFLPLNLIPKDARSALRNTLRLQRSMPIKQKQIVLENFLLGQRILNTLPVISKKEQDKDYKMYRKAMKNMNKSLQNQSMKSERLLSFHNQSISKEPVGSGRNLLTIRVIRMAFIRYKIDNLPDNLIQLKLRLGKRTLTSHLEQPSDFTIKDHVFAFRKKDLGTSPIQVRVQLIRKNQITILGSFDLQITQVMETGKTLQEVKYVQSLNKNGLVSGTIEFLLSYQKKL